MDPLQRPRTTEPIAAARAFSSRRLSRDDMDGHGVDTSTPSSSSQSSVSLSASTSASGSVATSTSDESPMLPSSPAFLGSGSGSGSGSALHPERNGLVYRPPHQRRGPTGMGVGISSVPLSRAPGHLPPPPTPNAPHRPPSLKLSRASLGASSDHCRPLRGPATAPVPRLARAVNDTLRSRERDRDRARERDQVDRPFSSPPLDTATTPGLSRKRGITMAVLVQDELIAESAPFTPQFPPAPRSAAPILNSQSLQQPQSPFPAPIGAGRPSVGLAQGSVGTLKRKPQPVPAADGSGTPAPTPLLAPVPVRKELILCRYYHTPGMVCTSSPCRFVHNLPAQQRAGGGRLATEGPTAALHVHLGSGPGTASLNLSINDNAKTPGLLGPTPSPYPRTGSSSGSDDPTRGTFAAAQAAAPVPASLELNEVDIARLTSGEAIAVRDETGAQMLGHVFKMSGGGKGPAGKSRLKFRTVPCRDFASGICAYGEYCSFIHDASNLYNDDKLGKKETPAEDTKDTHTEELKGTLMVPKVEEPTRDMAEAGCEPSLSVPRLLNQNLKKAQSINNLMATVAGVFPAGLGAISPTGAEDAMSSSFLSPSFFAPPERPKSTPAHIRSASDVDNTWMPTMSTPDANMNVCDGATLPSIDINITHPFSSADLFNLIPTQPVSQPMRVAHSLSPRTEPAAPHLPRSLSFGPTLPSLGPANPWSPPNHAAGGGDWPDLSQVARDSTTAAKPGPIPLPLPISPTSAWGKALPNAVKTSPPSPTVRLAPARVTPPKAGKGRTRRKNSKNMTVITLASPAFPKTTKATIITKAGIAPKTLNGKAPNGKTAEGEWPDLAPPASAAKSTIATSPTVQSVWGKGGPKVEPKPAWPSHSKSSTMNPPASPAASPATLGDDDAHSPLPPGHILQSDTIWTPQGLLVRVRPQQSYGTKLCKYFAMGNCNAGARCGFLHPAPGECAPVPITHLPPRKKYICAAFMESNCPLPEAECENAHLTVIPAHAGTRRMRTRPCHHFLLGRCHMGDECFFLHMSPASSAGSFSGSVRGVSGAASGVATPTQASASRNHEEGSTRSASEAEANPTCPSGPSAKAMPMPIAVPSPKHVRHPYEHTFPRAPHNTPRTPHTPRSPHSRSPHSGIEALSACSSLSSLSAAGTVPPSTPVSPRAGGYAAMSMAMPSAASFAYTCSPSFSPGISPPGLSPTADHCPDWAQGQCTGWCPLAHVGESALTEEALAAACAELRRQNSSVAESESEDDEDEDEMEIEITTAATPARTSSGSSSFSGSFGVRIGRGIGLGLGHRNGSSHAANGSAGAGQPPSPSAGIAV